MNLSSISNREQVAPHLNSISRQSEAESSLWSDEAYETLKNACKLIIQEAKFFKVPEDALAFINELSKRDQATELLIQLSALAITPPKALLPGTSKIQDAIKRFLSVELLDQKVDKYFPQLKRDIPCSASQPTNPSSHASVRERGMSKQLSAQYRSQSTTPSASRASSPSMPSTPESSFSVDFDEDSSSERENKRRKLDISSKKIDPTEQDDSQGENNSTALTSTNDADAEAATALLEFTASPLQQVPGKPVPTKGMVTSVEELERLPPLKENFFYENLNHAQKLEYFLRRELYISYPTFLSLLNAEPNTSRKKTSKQNKNNKEIKNKIVDVAKLYLPQLNTKFMAHGFLVSNRIAHYDDKNRIIVTSQNGCLSGKFRSDNMYVVYRTNLDGTSENFINTNLTRSEDAKLITLDNKFINMLEQSRSQLKPNSFAKTLLTNFINEKTRSVLINKKLTLVTLIDLYKEFSKNSLVLPKSINRNINYAIVDINEVLMRQGFMFTNIIPALSKEGKFIPARGANWATWNKREYYTIYQDKFHFQDTNPSVNETVS